MRKFILASHGKLSEGMVDSVEMILGKQPLLSWISLYPGELPKNMYQELLKEIEENPNDEYVIVTDLLGGSVNTAILQLLMKNGVYIITGMHLGLILSLCMSKEENTEKMIYQVLDETKGYIIYANDLLKKV